MDRREEIEEVNLMDHLAVLWKRKWLVVVPAVVLAAGAWIAGLMTPAVWEIEGLILPSRFLVRTDAGQFNEILTVDPKQVAGQVNQDSYAGLLAAELKLDPASFPKMRAENPKDTKLIRVTVRDHDIERGRRILSSLFNHLMADFDKKIELVIADNLNDIKLLEIQKDKVKQEILAGGNKIKISEERSRQIREEVKAVKARVDRIDAALQKALGEGKEKTDTVALLLYSNDIQNNLRYVDSLEEKLRDERVSRENEGLSVRSGEETVRQIDIKIALLEEKRRRIDTTEIVKEPAPAPGPVSPGKTRNALLAGALGAAFGAILAFFLEALKKAKSG